MGGTEVARADGTVDERLALQILVWCISDAVQTGEADRAATCDASIPQSVQDDILSLMTVAADPVLEIDPEEVTVAPEESAEFALTTNIFENDIYLNVTAGAVISICEPIDGVTLDGNVLRIAYPGSQDDFDVQLCVDPGTNTEVNVSVSKTHRSTTSIVWSQSQSNTDDVSCQVFAGFRESRSTQLQADADLVVQDEPITPAPELLATGVNTATVLSALAGLAVILSGGILVAAQRRKTAMHSA